MKILGNAANYAYPSLKHSLRLFLLLVLTSCTKQNGAARNELVFGLESEIKNFDIRSSRDKNLWKLTLLMSQALLRIQSDGSFLPDLAKTWETSDNKLIRFDLDEAATFHDGSPVSSKDVAYSYRDAMRSDSPLKSLLSVVESYRSPSDHKFEIRLKENIAEVFLSNVVPLIRILPREIAENKEQFSKHPIASGPWRFVSSKNRIVTLERHKRSANPNAIQRLLFKTIRSESTRLLALAAGDIDVLTGEIKSAHVDKLEKDFGIHSKSLSGNTLTYIGFNLSVKQLQSKLLRSKLFAAIDRKDLLNFQQGQVTGEIAWGLLPSHNTFFSKNTFPQAPLGLSPSKETLKILAPNSTRNQNLLAALRSQWLKAGIVVEVQTLDFASFLSKYNRGDYEMVLFSLTSKSDPDYLYKLFHSSQFPPGKNRFYYSNPKVDKLLTQARYSHGIKARKSIYDEIQSDIIKDLPILPLWYSGDTVLYRAEKEELLNNLNEELKILGEN